MALHSIISDAIAGSRAALSHTIYECQQCSRLWLQIKTNENVFVSYLPETEMRGVLKSQHKDTKDKEKQARDAAE